MLLAILLGAIQGLTEFLPISSSAHLRIFGELFSHQDPGATFTAITQLGTELAVICYFWRKIWKIIKAWFKQFKGANKLSEEEKHDAKLGWLVIIGTIPIGIAGYFLQSFIRDQFRSLWITAAMLIVFGILLWLADYFGKKTVELGNVTYSKGIGMGLAQTLALIPGVSRSGATITAGLTFGLTRVAAAELSFLLAIPAVFGSGLYELKEALGSVATSQQPAFSILETGIATLVAFIVGFLVISMLMKWIKTRTFLPFVIYRIVLGLVLIALLVTGIL
ncbi:MAG: undecaprenyl-diphosphate phosphatase [Microbacteriaceae bacterium]|nr:undecaprenyl-diphosphate phosphatase [Microbacteriaceae bacterium]